VDKNEHFSKVSWCLNLTLRSGIKYVLAEKTMTMSDPIADMLTRIRNAGKAKFNSVDIPGANLKTELAEVLKNEGFIKNYKCIKDSKQGILRIYLKYGKDDSHVILRLERVSKPSRRVYVGSKDIKSVYNGLGIAVLSTSKGIMTDKRARKENVGGEIICNIW
jgi:small subunit ribosomal protein S8